MCVCVCWFAFTSHFLRRSVPGTSRPPFFFFLSLHVVILPCMVFVASLAQMLILKESILRLQKQKYSACHYYKVLRCPVIFPLVPGGKLHHTSTAIAANIKPNIYHFDIPSISRVRHFHIL